MITPFFGPWRSRLSAMARRVPSVETSLPVLNLLSLLCASLIPYHLLSPADEGTNSRQRKWPLRLTFWTFLAQVFSPGNSCRAAIRQAQAQAALESRPVPASNSSAYCQARLRLPIDLLERILRQLGERLQQNVSTVSLWCGHVVKVLDGTTYNLPDTPRNQSAFPQSSRQKPGCGFPLVRLVAMFCLHSGAVVQWALGPYLTSELELLYSILPSLRPNEVFLADRHFGCYVVIALVQQNQAHAVCRLHASRKTGLPRGGRLFDKQVEWKRPSQVGAGFTKKRWEQLPASLSLRVVRFEVHQKGFRSQRITLVTTLLDAQKYPIEELARLYRYRWLVELSFRQIKTALQMEELSTLTPKMAERELLMHLLAYQLIRLLMQEAAMTAGVPLERMSFVGAADAARSFGEAILRATSKRKRQQLYIQLLEVIAGDPVPERPGRSEPRAVKRRPKPYPRLTCSRKKFRERPQGWRATAKNRGLI